MGKRALLLLEVLSSLLFYSFFPSSLTNTAFSFSKFTILKHKGAKGWCGDLLQVDAGISMISPLLPASVSQPDRQKDHYTSWGKKKERGRW